MDNHLSDMPTDLARMTRASVEAYIAERETPLTDELAALEDQPMTRAERLARKREIRDERAVLWRVRALWRRLHRAPDAGPEQHIG